MNEDIRRTIYRLTEAQKGPAAGDFSKESNVRLGSFKVGTDLLSLAKKELGGHYEDILFKNQRDHINAIPQEDLPKIWGKDNVPDAQDVLARNPKQAFQQWMRDVGKVDPKLAAHMRKTKENVPFYFYMYMIRLSGRDMADIIFKKYFANSQEYKPKKQESISEGSQDLPTIIRRVKMIKDSADAAVSALEKYSKDNQKFAPQLDNAQQALHQAMSGAKAAMLLIDKYLVAKK